MVEQNTFSLPDDYATPLSTAEIKKQNDYPFKNHAQFDTMTDCLIRKYCHHILLQAPYDKKLFHAFLSAFSLHLTSENAPNALRHTEIIFLPAIQIEFDENYLVTWQNEIDYLWTKAKQTNKIFIVAYCIDDAISSKIQTSLLQKLLPLTTSIYCRIILCSTNPLKNYAHLSSQFQNIQLYACEQKDSLSFLRTEAKALEAYHQVSIPDELISEAYQLIERFVTEHKCLEKILLLLDSAAAETAVYTPKHANNKVIVNRDTLIKIFSRWIQLPQAAFNKPFNLNELQLRLNQQLIGQPQAAKTLAENFRSVFAKVQPHTGPFASFLFIGETQTGKTNAAQVITDYFFNHSVLLIPSVSKQENKPLLDVPIIWDASQDITSLKIAIHQLPYAVILFKHFEQYPKHILRDLEMLLQMGMLSDIHGRTYSFRQAIIILTTTEASEELQQLSNRLQQEESQENLFQIVNSIQSTPSYYIENQDFYAVKQLCKKLTKSIEINLPETIASIPFLRFSTSALHQIIEAKLKTLRCQLHFTHEIELSYAPEIISWIATNIKQNRAQPNQLSIECGLKHVYECIEIALLLQKEAINTSRQLNLQLDETGESLRCEWITITPSTVGQHTL